MVIAKSHPTTNDDDPVSQALDTMTAAIDNGDDPAAAVLTACKAFTPVQRHSLGITIISILTALPAAPGAMDGPVRHRLAELAEMLGRT